MGLFGFIDLPTRQLMGSNLAVAGNSPNALFRYALLAFLVVGWNLSAAQLALHVETPTDLVTTNRELTYSITVTNQSGLLYNNVVLNSSFNSAVTLVSATNYAGTVALEGTSIVFRTPTLTSVSNAVMQLVVQPQSAGMLTNTFQLVAIGVNEGTNVVTQVFAAEANLGVSLTTETNRLVTGDWNEFQVQVSNAGPEAANNVVVTNLLPAGAEFLSIKPASVSVAQSDTQLVYSAGSLALGSNAVFKVRLQVNNLGTNQVTASVAATDVSDPFADDNTTTNSLVVVAPQTNAISASFVSGQVFNPQTGLMEQKLRLTNGSGAAVEGARAILSNLNATIYNASGTNDGKPFVALIRPLAAGETSDLLLEYFSPERVPFGNPTVVPWGVPAYVPVAPSGGVEVAVSGWEKLPTGGFLVEFPAEPGKVYQLIYSDDVTYSNALRALPAITAPADRVQWIDEGPPKTRRHPADVSTRFYRVIEAQ